MQLLSLLTVATALTTLAFACNYERITQDPNYAEIDKPKKTLNVPKPHGICVAPNGDFAVVSYSKGSKVYIYYSCGKLMKPVDLTKRGYIHGTDCTFTNSHLYVVDEFGKKVFKLSMTGVFKKVIPGRFMRATSCKNQLYLTTSGGGKNVAVLDSNDKEIRRISVPAGQTRGIIVGIDGNLYISAINQGKVYSYTTEGKQLGVKTYSNIKADGLAMDSAGNLLIADHTGRKIVVYSPCGDLVKTIQVNANQVLDVEISNDGAVLVADYTNSKVYFY